MNNQYRLKLEFKFKKTNNHFSGDNYILIIKVLKKDNRFDVKPDFNSKGDNTRFVYTSTKGFAIITDSSLYKGEIGFFSLKIPNKKYLNRKIEYRFGTDTARKTYLRHLHGAILEWSDNWGSFKNEPKTKFKSMNNKWFFYITK